MKKYIEDLLYRVADMFIWGAILVPMGLLLVFTIGMGIYFLSPIITFMIIVTLLIIL